MAYFLGKIGEKAINKIVIRQTKNFICLLNKALMWMNANIQHAWLHPNKMIMFDFWLVFSFQLNFHIEILVLARLICVDYQMLYIQQATATLSYLIIPSGWQTKTFACRITHVSPIKTFNFRFAYQINTRKHETTLSSNDIYFQQTWELC